MEAVLNTDRITPGARLGVAVSGGADSIALLTLLHALSRFDLTVLHVNHGLRGAESDADEAFVRSYAADLGLPILIHNPDTFKNPLPEAPEHAEQRRAASLAGGLSPRFSFASLRPKALIGNNLVAGLSTSSISLPAKAPVTNNLAAGLSHKNLEAAARATRYTWFDSLDTLDHIATGHTLSDQAETVLFRFLRGAGTAGLSGIQPARGKIIRPLLNATREHLRQYLTERQIAWREDSSNVNLTFARNRIRRQLLPSLTRDWNPALPQILSQTAEWARAEEEYWNFEIPRLALKCVRFQNGAALLNAPKLTALPLAAARRVVRFAISQVKGDLLGIDFAHCEQILELAGKPAGAGRLRIPGLDVCRSFDWIRLNVHNSAQPAQSCRLRVPCEIQTANVGLTLQLERKNVDSVYNTDGHQLDWNLLSGSLELRNWRPGDHYRPAGRASDSKLKHLFQKARIPSWERPQWPVITIENSIAWTRCFGPAAAFLPSAGTETVLVIREKSNQNVQIGRLSGIG